MRNRIAPLVNALNVIVKDPKISAWLQSNDPQALSQALRAVNDESLTQLHEDVADIEAEMTRRGL